MIDHNRATGRKLHFALVGRFDLRFDLKAREQRYFISIKFNLLLIRGHDLANKAQCFGVNLGAVDQYFADVLAQVVTHSANDDVGFTVD